MWSSIYALKNGAPWVWGWNGWGELGTGDLVSYSSPVAMIGNHSFTAIFPGTNAFIASKWDEDAWGSGTNLYGQLGTGSTTSYSSPVAVIGSHKFYYAGSLGETHSMSLKIDGFAWCMGNNDSGQLGNNASLNSYSSPVAVIGNHSFCRITGGANAGGTGGFTLALKADGTAWAWGNNIVGQLGTGDTTSYSSPVAIIGNHSFIKILSSRSSTGGQSFALKADGSLWSWGGENPGVGMLGHNDGLSYSSPVAVVGNHSFIDFCVSYSHTVALKDDGSIWGWGSDSVGQLGKNSAGNVSSPVAVIGNHSFTELMSGYRSTFGLKENGELWAWGLNDNGQLGVGDMTNYSSPVKVIGNHSFTQIAMNQPIRGYVQLDNIIGLGWLYYAPLTYDKTYAGTGDISNIPICLIWTGSQATSNLPQAMFDADGTTPAASDGKDVRFSTDSAGQVQIPFEVVSFATNNDPSLVTAEIWVKLPTLYNATNTTFYIWWGNSSATALPAAHPLGRNNVWDSNYSLVSHMDDSGGTSNVLDSTGFAHTVFKGAAGTPAVGSGKIGKSQAFTGTPSTNWLESDTADFHYLSNQYITCEAWIYPTSVSSTGSIANDRWSEASFEFKRNGTLLQFRYANAAGDAWHGFASGAVFAINNWYHVAVVLQYTQAASAILYVNGSAVASSWSEGDGTAAPHDTFGKDQVAIGKIAEQYEIFKGSIDEIRITNGVARSADWFKASYANQNNIASSVTIGSITNAPQTWHLGRRAYVNTGAAWKIAQEAWINIGGTVWDKIV